MRSHNSPTWREFARRDMYQDVYRGSAEFTTFLAQRMQEYKDFYDAIGLGANKP